MKINIENTSSPGASFTDNTNQVLMEIFKWINRNENLIISFRDFRRKLEDEVGINDNNNRNIYPLLKYCEFVEYEKGGSIDTSKFFTNYGLAYIQSLNLIENIETHNNLNNPKTIAAIKLAKENVALAVFDGLKALIKSDANYVEAFKYLISFLIKYKSISREEYALLLYKLKKSSNVNLEQILVDLEDEISNYRDNNLHLDISVKVRNDISIRNKTKEKYRNENITYLTSYGYFVSLLSQAHLIYKNSGCYIINENKFNKLKELAG